MKKSDFALISALYDSKKGGLYADVYFPIIKYTIVSLFYKKEQQEYYTQDNVKDFIIQNFGIEIPTLVIKKSVVAIRQKSSELELEIYDNGAEFKILKAWDFSINEDIDARAHEFDKRIDDLESEYQKYIESEGLESEKTFLSFISDNTDDILGYFENESVEKIDGEYAIMAYFLKHLQKTTPELFKIANELFWGSVIAGFLKREKISSLSCNATPTEYFLDTPIVMGLLNLSSTEKETYSREVFEIIKASGGLPKIHPITMEEVYSIISSVENSVSPLPNTAIEAAWYRDTLSKSKLARKRVSAVNDLENMGAIIFPSTSQQDIVKTKDDYSKKVDVKNLTQKRGGLSSDRGLFRDIHDVFMDDYIDERRKVKGTDNCCFFVTTNNDLVRFCIERKNGSRMRTVGASRVILELWMHNTKQSGLENKALTEMMARCMDINNHDVRNKLGIVARYYNSTKREDFDPMVFQEIVKCLYKRDKEVLAAVEGLKEDGVQSIDVNLRIIVEKAHQSSTLENSKISDIQQQINSLQRRLDETEQEKTEAIESGRNEEIRKRELQELLDKQTITAQRQRDILNCYEEKEKLSLQRDVVRKEIDTLESAKSEYIDKNDHYKFYLGLEICMIIVFLMSFTFGAYQIVNDEEFTFAAIIAFLALLIPITTALTRKSLYVIERRAIHDEIRMKSGKNWESMNPDYLKKKKRLEEIDRKIADLEKTIKEGYNDSY
jgi:hypothetical protein